jgi:hypothetical protein
MTEQTNQSEAKLVFDSKDFTPEELKAEVTETEEVTPEVTKEEVKPVEPIKKKVKYNGKEVELTEEELTTNAQKGMNYDKIKEELDKVKNSDENKMLLELAKEEGFKDGATYLKSLKDSKVQKKVDDRVQELVDEGVPLDHAKKMAQLELSVPQEAKKDEVEPLTQSFAELFNEYPETAEMKELSDFPDEVQKAIKEGKSPVVAYSKYLAKKAEEAKAIAVQNESARLRDTGSLQTSQPEVPEDDFVSGFMGKYKKG